MVYVGCIARQGSSGLSANIFGGTARKWQACGSDALRVGRRKNQDIKLRFSTLRKCPIKLKTGFL